jgi:NAD(P)H-dependent flavin oxidoreductase YrpB (nitropropane dioxygenase family)
MALPELLKDRLRIPLIGAPMFIVSQPQLVIAQCKAGIIAVCAGAGGHAGPLSPFALVKEIRKKFDGTIILSGCMTSGGDVLAAQADGC